MTLPSRSPMTPGYGFGSILPPYSAANPHKGVDLQHIPDHIIYAPFTGKVTQAYNDRDGNGSYMTEPNGRFHGMLHASEYLVPNGANVSEGQPIAVMGETGLAEGVHLHWAVKENGVFIDPMSLVKGDIMASQDIADETVIRLAYNIGLNRDVTTAELAARLAANQTVEKVLRDVWTSDEHTALLNKVSAEATVLKPGKYQVN